MSKIKFLEIGYLLGIVALFFYSFTQVDLSLTLSQVSIVQQLEKAFQYIGYFNRPLSTYLFIAIIFLLYVFYIKILLSIKQFSSKKIWGIILFSAILLGVAYNAFSYDLFNYIFDAKIVTYYQENPYEKKALDYVSDPMLSFMHWTHRTYPYGPVWLGLTVPLSYLGLNYFLITFFLFKAFLVGAFLATVWLLQKVLTLTDDKNKWLGIAFFALNPFVLIEGVVSGHNDTLMIFFLVLGIYFLVKKKYVLTFIALLLSYGIKFASSSIAFPIHIAIIVGLAIGLFIFPKVQKKLSWDMIFISGGCFMIIPIVLASFRTTFQPWYLLSLIPFAALVSKKYFIIIPVIIITFFALLEYVPFLFLGNWDSPIPTYLLWLRVVGIGTAIVVTTSLLFLVKNRKNGTI